jgi:hypothetical protein
LSSTTCLVSRGTHQGEASTCHRVGVLGQAPHAQHAVVGLHYYVAILRVRKDAVCLDELLGEPVVQPLEHKGAEAGARAAGDGVQQHEAFQRV